ncbi:MAG: phosphoribosylanthranilate isomerase [Methanomicrobiales archaeon]|jgi:phosphoribosylanthranilate isomerase|nr:phosphoribosylanthranilate isomerase [Methanomicrobiales archaeon]
MRIKVCGLTSVEDARAADAAGADAIGVVVFSRSQREVSLVHAEEIFSALHPFTTRVLVTHTSSPGDLEAALAIQPDAVQISHPFPRPMAKGVRLIRVAGQGGQEPVPDCDAIIIDESHGSGKPFDLGYAERVVARSEVPVILAGGLTPENVGSAIARVRPYAVDVASGVERSPGIKDHARVRAFVGAARRAFYGE